MNPINFQASAKIISDYQFYKHKMQLHENFQTNIVNQHVLFTALKQFDFEALKDFIKKGADININENGYSLLACIEDPGLFMWLLERKACYVNPECPRNSNGVLFHIQQQANSDWLPCLLYFIKNTSFTSILNFPIDQLQWLIAYAKKNNEMADVLIGALKALSMEHRENNLLYNLPDFITAYGPKKFAQGLIYGWKNDLISMSFLDKVVTKSSFVCCYLRDCIWLNVLIKNIPDLHVNQIQEQMGGVSAAIFCMGLQNADREELVSILLLIRTIESSIDAIPREIKKKCVQHVSEQFSLCLRNFGLWSSLANASIEEKDLFLLVKFGFNPNENISEAPTILFTALAPLCSQTFIEAAQVDVHRVNDEGKNAIEFFLSKNPLRRNMVVLIEYYNEYLPFEIILHLYQLGIGHLNDSTECHPVLKALFLINQRHTSLPLFEFLKEIQENEGNLKIDAIINEIPSAPIVSIVLAYLMRVPKLNYKSVNLLTGLSRNDILALHDYLFLHPHAMNRLLEIFFVIMEVRHTEYTHSLVSHSVFVSQMMRGTGELKHMKDSLWQCPRWQQSLVKSYYKFFIPEKTTNLEMHTHSELSLLGRTVVGHPAKNEQNCIGYKIRNMSEYSKKFFQELFVMKAFNKHKEHFESCIQKPLELYHDVQAIPDNIRAFLSNGQHALHDMFTYEAPKDTFTYLQNSPTIEAFREGQRRCLIDLTTMIEIGIYPEPTLWHSVENRRLYLLLIDLISCFKTFCTTTGAGALNQPFFKLQFSDNRLSGRVDLNDSWLRFGPRGVNDVYTGPKSLFVRKSNGAESGELVGSKQNVFLDQMIALSTHWLEHHLLLIEFFRKNGGLNWKDPAFLEELGGYLREDFCWIFSTRSGKSLEETFAQVSEWKIDWIQMARQNAFLCNNTSDGYIPFFNEGKLPENLYPEGTKVFVSARKGYHYSELKGQLTNGHQNIGFNGGILGMEEFVKANMLLYMSIILKESAFI